MRILVLQKTRSTKLQFWYMYLVPFEMDKKRINSNKTTTRMLPQIRLPHTAGECSQICYIHIHHSCILRFFPSIMVYSMREIDVSCRYFSPGSSHSERTNRIAVQGIWRLHGEIGDTLLADHILFRHRFRSQKPVSLRGLLQDSLHTVR